jgi:hypothetical protein
MWCIGTPARKTAAVLIIAAAARGENETQHSYILYLYDIAVYIYIYNQYLILYKRSIYRYTNLRTLHYGSSGSRDSVVVVGERGGKVLKKKCVFITNIRDLLCS